MTRKDAVLLEEDRLQSSATVPPPLHERHRAFPAVFENRPHRRVLDVAAGVGYAGERIQAAHPARLVCNDIAPTCLESLRARHLTALSYSIDEAQAGFPFAAGSFDAVIALATIEHVLQLDEFVTEIHRILAPEGCFYVSAPNYSGLYYLLPFLWSGRTFHNPLDPAMRYEFYAHVRYFTYRTLLEFIPPFGFVPDTVYLPLPRESTNYQAMLAARPLKAHLYRLGMTLACHLSPRWAAEPILCFRKSASTHPAPHPDAQPAPQPDAHPDARRDPRRGVRKVLL